MALETVIFQQDPFDIYSFGGVFSCSNTGLDSQEKNMEFLHQQSLKRACSSAEFDSSSNLEYSSSQSPIDQYVKDLESNNSSSQEKGRGGGNMMAAAASGRRKRRRCRAVKNQAEVEHQRMSHIALERNRRKQMNDHLSELRSVMPASYVQRGDQASIVGGAINFLKELEQMLQSLEADKRIKQQLSDSSMNIINTSHCDLFSDFFSFPQYSTRSSDQTIADIEVTMIEGHANLKILSRNYPKQLMKILAGLHSLHLDVLHLNVTSIGDMVLYSLNVKVEDECQMTSVNEIAAAVYDHLAKIQEENAFL